MAKWQIVETKSEQHDISRGGKAFRYDAGDLDECVKLIRKNRKYDDKDIIIHYPIDGGGGVIRKF